MFPESRTEPDRKWCFNQSQTWQNPAGVSCHEGGRQTPSGSLPDCVCVTHQIPAGRASSKASLEVSQQDWATWCGPPASSATRPSPPSSAPSLHLSSALSSSSFTSSLSPFQDPPIPCLTISTGVHPEALHTLAVVLRSMLEPVLPHKSRHRNPKQVLSCLKTDFTRVSVQSLDCARLFVTPWTAACQAPL